MLRTMLRHRFALAAAAVALSASCSTPIVTRITAGAEDVPLEAYGPEPTVARELALLWAREKSMGADKDLEVEVGPLAPCVFETPYPTPRRVYCWQATVEVTGGDFLYKNDTPPWTMCFQNDELIAIRTSAGSHYALGDTKHDSMRRELAKLREDEAWLAEVRAKAEAGEYGGSIRTKPILEALEEGDLVSVRAAVHRAEKALEEKRVAQERRQAIERYFESHPKRAKYRELVETRRAQIGMNGQELRFAFGEPRSIHRTATSFGTTEQWVYGQFGPYFYLEGGVITSWQD